MQKRHFLAKYLVKCVEWSTAHRTDELITFDHRIPGHNYKIQKYLKDYSYTHTHTYVTYRDFCTQARKYEQNTIILY